MIRSYNPEDKTALIALLKLNIPHYFAPSEESDFVEYLDNHVEDYFVVEENGQLVGAGGINYFAASGQARISWDVIHPAFQGKGIGRKLTQFRIEHIKKNSAIGQIVVRTTQLVYNFYQKLGFRLEKTEKDFWAKGFDLYQMTLLLDKKTDGQPSTS